MILLRGSRVVHSIVIYPNAWTARGEPEFTPTACQDQKDR
jgi:hypothetical protein